MCCNGICCKLTAVVDSRAASGLRPLRSIIASRTKQEQDGVDGGAAGEEEEEESEEDLLVRGAGLEHTLCRFATRTTAAYWLLQ